MSTLDSLSKMRPLDLRKDPEDIRDFTFKKLMGSRGFIKTSEYLKKLPVSVDHSSKMSPVKDQGQLGSCVAFSVCAIKEWQEQKEHAEEVEMGKKNHRDNKYYDLSVSWVYWMSKKIDPWPNEEGTSERYAMKVLQKIGVPTEKAWPYNDFNYGEPKRWAEMVARWAFVGSYYKIESLSELKSSLYHNGPLSIGISCFEEIFEVGSNGVIPYPLRPQFSYGGHAICAVGYDDRTGYVKIKNSWGPEWGESGYGYLPYKYVIDHMWDAWACVDMRVTKEMLKGPGESIFD